MYLSHIYAPHLSFDLDLVSLSLYLRLLILILVTLPPITVHVHRRSQGVQVHPPRATKKVFLGIFVGMRQNGAAFCEVHSHR